MRDGNGFATKQKEGRASVLAMRIDELAKNNFELFEPVANFENRHVLHFPLLHFHSSTMITSCVIWNKQN